MIRHSRDNRPARPALVAPYPVGLPLALPALALLALEDLALENLAADPLAAAKVACRPASSPGTSPS